MAEQVKTGPAVDRLRALALALPEAYEQVAHGEPTFRVGKRMFATFADAETHHGRGRDCAWLNAPPGVQQYRVEAEPEKYFVPPYVGGKGWLGLYLDAVSEDELRECLTEAYLMAAPRRLADLVPEN